MRGRYLPLDHCLVQDSSILKGYLLRCDHHHQYSALLGRSIDPLMVDTSLDNAFSSLERFLVSAIKLQHYFPGQDRDIIQGQCSVHWHGENWGYVCGAEQDSLGWASGNLTGDVWGRGGVGDWNRNASMDVAEGTDLRAERVIQASSAVRLEDGSAVLSMGGDDHARSWELGCGIHSGRRVLGHSREENRRYNGGLIKLECNSDLALMVWEIQCKMAPIYTLSLDTTRQFHALKNNSYVCSEFVILKFGGAHLSKPRADHKAEERPVSVRDLKCRLPCLIGNDGRMGR
jgi:hypothetical protein